MTFGLNSAYLLGYLDFFTFLKDTYVYANFRYTF